MDTGNRPGSSADLLRECARPGTRAPVLAVGDGALGSGRRCARCSRTPGAAGLGAQGRQRLERATQVGAPGSEGGTGGDVQRRRQAHANAYGAKFSKATAKITDDLDVLMTFYDYPACRSGGPRYT